MERLISKAMEQEAKKWREFEKTGDGFDDFCKRNNPNYR